MRRHSYLIILLALMLACGLPAASPSSPVESGRSRSARVERGSDAATPTPTALPQPAATAVPRPLASGLKTELVADGLQLPVNLAFAPDGRLFFTEVSRGTVRVVERGRLLPDPVAVLEVAQGGEQGLLGLTLDPGFATNHELYLFYSEPRNGQRWRNRLVRLTEAGN